MVLRMTGGAGSIAILWSTIPRFSREVKNMSKQIVDYGEKRLNDHRGYEIWKIWDITATGEKINTQYQVADEDDAIDFFDTLAAAKKYIDTVLV